MSRKMTAPKQRLVGSGLAMALWFAGVTWGAPLIEQRPPGSALFSIILVAGAVAGLLFTRARTTSPDEKALCGRMLLLVAAGVAVSLASSWALR